MAIYDVQVRYFDVSAPNHYSQVWIKKFNSYKKAISFLQNPVYPGLRPGHVLAMTQRVEQFNYHQPLAFAKMLTSGEWVRVEGNWVSDWNAARAGEIADYTLFATWSYPEENRDMNACVELGRVDIKKIVLFFYFTLKAIQKLKLREMSAGVLLVVADCISGMEQWFIEPQYNTYLVKKIDAAKEMVVYTHELELIRAVRSTYYAMMEWRGQLGDFVREIDNVFKYYQPKKEYENFMIRQFEKHLSLADAVNNVITTDVYGG